MSGPGQDSAGSDCGNVNSWEFTCPLWEELDFPDTQSESLGQEEKGNWGAFGLCR